MNTFIPDDSRLRILIPWDNDTALDALLGFARALGGRDAHVMILPLVPEKLPENVVSQSVTRGMPLEIVRPSCAEAGLEYDISAIAEKRAADLILMTTSCRPDGRLDSRCLPARIALDSSVPVLLTRTHPEGCQTVPPSIRRLLIPLDGSSRAAQTLPFAARLARRLDIPVQFVMVIDPAQILPTALIHAPESEDLLAGVKSDAHWALKRGEELMARYGVTVTSSLMSGPVIGSIQEKIQPGDLVMLTTHGHGGAPRGRLGSVAARMVADIPGPMVIMRGHPLPDRVVRRHLA